MREPLDLPCARLPHSAAGVVGKAGSPPVRDRDRRRRGDNCPSIAGAESCPAGYARKLVQDEHAHIELAALAWARACLLYTSDAADDLLCVDLGGRRII